MTNNDKDRERFEKWWPTVGQTIGKVAAWEAWQAALATVSTAQPVAWFEAEESARGAELKNVINGLIFSTRWHTTKPKTTNPVWELYAGPVSTAPSEAETRNRVLEEAADVVEGIRWGYDGDCGAARAIRALQTAAPQDKESGK